MKLLSAMALFIEVANAKSFRRVGEVIGTPNSTLCQRINLLEIAIRLHRTTRKVELTEADQIYFERRKRLFDKAKLAHDSSANW
ncbi:hypothetical protein SAMN04487926_11951 [Paraburkholderia steynii]|uniref:HTH lysR-type domain-containing protein n=1 Tax=Paraburkholderia steynii TaxID=1245441 RepID=A0A7Z7BCI5_9BURK|nr:hypothetical protein SAMN04487926_11951 [Paraburkholderia steynii]